nr:hypothetical protein [Burkholderia sp. WSM2230]
MIRFLARHRSEQHDARDAHAQWAARTDIDGEHLDRIRAGLSLDRHRVPSGANGQESGVSNLVRKCREIRGGDSQRNRTGPAGRKTAGVLAPDEAYARDYLAAGATFVAIGTDVSLLTGAANKLLATYKDAKEASADAAEKSGY